MRDRHPAGADRAAPGPWAWTALGAVTFAATWALVALPVDAVQRALAPGDRDPLAFFAVYASPDLRMLAGQLARGALPAPILAPFRDVIATHRRPLAVLFGVYFGVYFGPVALGSVEPLPGSLERWFYTETTLLGRAVTAVAAAVRALGPTSLLTGLPEVATQMLVFSVPILAWERRRSRAPRRRPRQPTTR